MPFWYTVKKPTYSFYPTCINRIHKSILLRRECLLRVCSLAYFHVTSLYVRSCYNWPCYSFYNENHLYSLQWRHNERDGISFASIVCSTVCSSADQRKHQISASLALERGIHQWPVDSPHEGPVTQKMFPIDDVIMCGRIRMGSLAYNPSHSICTGVGCLF